MSQPGQSAGAIFDAALDLPKEQCAAFVERACAGDAPLRERVEALLRAHEKADSFMAGPVLKAPPNTMTLPLLDQSGQTIGRYKLLQQIGEGGCGVVYMAEQAEPVKRMVALKVIKPGMDTKEVIARFEAERQALAMMDHPNIAKVLDAGTTESGRPYFVMELVRGIKITEYCDQNNLTTGDRLALFTQICRAVQHAHQKGIIHRDIKPSNILVTMADGVAIPKVIDFGIAKATQGKLTDNTLFTAFEQFIGTPAYMSPEQAEMSALGLDTRCDVYSLGVLLYELLTGKTPFDTKELLKVGLDEIRRTIREEEPPRPSTRLSTMLAADLTSAAKRRQTEAPKLIHCVRGDLDWIVMKCLEKDRTRRYETANGLAMDVQRHLQNELVLARPPSVSYRIQKMARRNKLAFATTTAVAAALLIGLGLSTWQFMEKSRAYQRAVAAERAQNASRQEAEIARANEAKQRGQAEMEASKSRQVAQFLEDMLKSVGPSVALGRDTTLLREILEKTSERVGRDLTNQPAVETELCTVLAETYLDLDAFKQAESRAREGLARARSFFGENHPATARLLVDLGFALYGQRKEQEALDFMTQGYTLQKKLFPDGSLELANSMDKIAELYRFYDQDKKAENLLRESLKMKRKLLGNKDPVLIGSLNALSWLLLKPGTLPEAESLVKDALRLHEMTGNNEDSGTAISYRTLGVVFGQEGKLAEGAAMLQMALGIEKRLFGAEHLDVAWTLNYLGEVLYEDSKFGEGSAAFREALAMRSKLPKDDLSLITRNFTDSLILQAGAGQGAEAVASLAQCCELCPENTRASLMLAAWQAWFGKVAEYETIRERFVQHALGTDDPLTADQAAKAYCLRPSTNIEFLHSALALAHLAVKLGGSNTYLPWFRMGLGIAEYRNGQYDRAAQTLVMSEQEAGGQQDIEITSRLFRVMSLFRCNREDQSRALFAEVDARMPPHPRGDNQTLGDGTFPDLDGLISWMANKEARELLKRPPTQDIRK